MKRYLIAVSLVLVLILTACGGQPTSRTDLDAAPDLSLFPVAEIENRNAEPGSDFFSLDLTEEEKTELAGLLSGTWTRIDNPEYGLNVDVMLRGAGTDYLMVSAVSEEEVLVAMKWNEEDRSGEAVTWSIQADGQAVKDWVGRLMERL